MVVARFHVLQLFWTLKRLKLERRVLLLVRDFNPEGSAPLDFSQAVSAGGRTACNGKFLTFLTFCSNISSTLEEQTLLRHHHRTPSPTRLGLLVNEICEHTLDLASGSIFQLRAFSTSSRIRTTYLNSNPHTSFSNDNVIPRRRTWRRRDRGGRGGFSSRGGRGGFGGGDAAATLTLVHPKASNPWELSCTP